MIRRAAAVAATTVVVALLCAGTAQAQPELPCFIASLQSGGVTPHTVCVLN